MYILTEQLHGGGDPMLPWKKYTKYLERNKEHFPASAYRVATKYILGGGRSNPHDAWLESAIFSEPAKGKRNHLRHLNLRVRLLGAYHDRYLEFFYPKVFSYTVSNPASVGGHFDWRYSEVRLSKSGKVIHEIEWAGPPGASAHWIIESSDIRFRSFLIKKT